MNTRLWLAGWLLLASSAPLQAQDADGCRDHPLFNRIKGYVIASCENKEFDDFRFPVGKAADSESLKRETVEGRKSELSYFPGENQTPASPLQVLRNFQAAARAVGGTVEGEYEHEFIDLSSFGGGNRATTLRIARDGSEVWVLLRANDDGPYALTIVEREVLRQDVIANELLEKINREGHVALYLNFDTGKASLRPDATPTLEQVLQMLAAAPALKLEIGGHTDNAGKPGDNQRLSEARAAAVVKALVARGIAAGRLTSKGYGDSQPIADNHSEAGRAKNRRVELSRR